MWEADESPNIQVAAGDGMLDHVRALVEEKGVNGKAGGTAGLCVSFPAAHLVAPCAPGSYVGVVMALVLDITACALVYRLMLASAPPPPLLAPWPESVVAEFSKFVVGGAGLGWLPCTLPAWLGRRGVISSR